MLFFIKCVWGKCVSLRVRGRGELNALLVRPALNVFSLYALKLLSRNRSTEQSNKTIFSFLFSPGAAVTVDEK